MAGLEELTKNSVYNINIYSYSIDAAVRFPAFLTDYSDSFKSSWSPTTVLGKMDPIATYKNTTRTITIAFDVPNQSIEEAIANMRKVDAIIKGMYPVYVSDGSEETNGFKSYVMNSPPMFRVKFANLITQASELYGADTVRFAGLLGYINDFSFKPDNSSGYFIDNNKLLPKLIKVNFTLNVIHEHGLGNTKNSKDRLVPRLKEGNDYIMNFPHNYDQRKINDESKTFTLDDKSTNNSDAALKTRLENNLLD